MPAQNTVKMAIAERRERVVHSNCKQKWLTEFSFSETHRKNDLFQ